MDLAKRKPITRIPDLDQPRLSLLESERNGYVLNVEYTCGSLLYENELYIPYAMLDYASSVAKITVEKLLDHIK
jgi:predicted GH43/DUF377 family glycosyl hydrolase